MKELLDRTNYCRLLFWLACLAGMGGMMAPGDVAADGSARAEAERSIEVCASASAYNAQLPYRVCIPCEEEMPVGALGVLFSVSIRCRDNDPRWALLSNEGWSEPEITRHLMSPNATCEIKGTGAHAMCGSPVLQVLEQHHVRVVVSDESVSLVVSSWDQRAPDASAHFLNDGESLMTFVVHDNLTKPLTIKLINCRSRDGGDVLCTFYTNSDGEHKVRVAPSSEEDLRDTVDAGAASGVHRD